MCVTKNFNFLSCSHMDGGETRRAVRPKLQNRLVEGAM